MKEYIVIQTRDTNEIVAVVPNMECAVKFCQEFATLEEDYIAMPPVQLSDVYLNNSGPGWDVEIRDPEDNFPINNLVLQLVPFYPDGSMLQPPIPEFLKRQAD